MLASTGFACLALLLLTAPAFAHGNGTLFSSPTDADGASVYWNPAAMATASESLLEVVGNAQIPQATYQRFGTDAQQGGRPFPKVALTVAEPEPTGGFIIDKVWRKRLRIGFTFTVPSTGGAGWPETVQDGSQVVLGPTRYQVTSAELFNAYAMVGASIAVHKTFAIGISANLIFSYLNVHKDVDLANQPPLTSTIPCEANPFGCENPQLSAPLHLAASGFSGGASIGFLWQPIERLRIGAAYVSPTKVTLKATISVDATKLNAFAQQFLPSFMPLSVNGSGHARVDVPQEVHAGIAFDATPRIEVMAMMRWVNTSATEIISGTITQKTSTLLPGTIATPSVKNDTWLVSARVVGRVRERWKLGFGVEYNAKTTPSAYTTPANVDFDNIGLNLGAQFRVIRHLAIGATFTQFIVIPRTITASAYSNDSPAPYNTPDPTGKYTANSERIGLDLTAFF